MSLFKSNAGLFNTSFTFTFDVASFFKSYLLVNSVDSVNVTYGVSVSNSFFLYIPKFTLFLMAPSSIC